MSNQDTDDEGEFASFEHVTPEQLETLGNAYDESLSRIFATDYTSSAAEEFRAEVARIAAADANRITRRELSICREMGADPAVYARLKRIRDGR